MLGEGLGDAALPEPKQVVADYISDFCVYSNSAPAKPLVHARAGNGNRPDPIFGQVGANFRLSGGPVTLLRMGRRVL